MIIGIFGLSLMLLAVLFGEGLSEKLLTVIGSSIVAYAHYKNHKVCKELECHCHDKQNLSI